MSKQPKALRIADFIQEHDGNFFYEESSRTDGELSDAVYEAAYILRLQHELIGELVEALSALDWAFMSNTRWNGDIPAEIAAARAALSKAKEQQ